MFDAFMVFARIVAGSSEGANAPDLMAIFCYIALKEHYSVPEFNYV